MNQGNVPQGVPFPGDGPKYTWLKAQSTDNAIGKISRVMGSKWRSFRGMRESNGVVTQGFDLKYEEVEEEQAHGGEEV